MTARDFFWDSSGTVRPPWRLAIFAASIVLSSIAVNGAVLPLVSWVLARVGARVVLFPWTLLASAVVAHMLTFRWVEPRGWDAVRLGTTALRLRPIATSALLGAVAIGIPVVPVVAMGWLRVVPQPPGSWFAAAVAMAFFLAPAALWEELLFRGYAFTVVREWWGTPAALGVTSAAFGAVHLQNAGATPASIAVVVLAGLFLGGVLVATRSLWAAFAAHLAWNWVLAGVLHSAVSGIPFSTPVYRVVDAGPDWATGGAWGPEGGVPAAVGLVSVSMYLYVRRRRREEP